MSDFKEYHVTWEIELKAESPLEAARAALRVHRDPESIANVFDVIGEGDKEMVRIDLAEEGEEEGEDDEAAPEEERLMMAPCHPEEGIVVVETTSNVCLGPDGPRLNFDDQPWKAYCCVCGAVVEIPKGTH